MKQFIWDMIHLTEGEKFIKYWWMWLLSIALIFGISFAYAAWKNRKTEHSKESLEDFMERFLGGKKK